MQDCSGEVYVDHLLLRNNSPSFCEAKIMKIGKLHSFESNELSLKAQP
jgi:hypothetical protein